MWCVHEVVPAKSAVGCVLYALAALLQDSPGQMTAMAQVLPGHASVIVWIISDRFIYFILTVKRRWRSVFWGRQLKMRKKCTRAVFWGRQLKKVVNFFEEKSAPGWFGWRIVWPRNDLASLLRWRRHWLHGMLILSTLVDCQGIWDMIPVTTHVGHRWSFEQLIFNKRITEKWKKQDKLEITKSLR